MKKWNFILDVKLCQGCNNCFLACRDEFYKNDFPPYSLAQPRHGQKWISVKQQERGQYPRVDVAYLTTACMHCDDAPCITKSNGAVYKREDGIVIIDPEKSKGKKDIVNTCPYNAIFWNEESQVPQKCTFCIHLLEEGWKMPRCVQACPTDALKVVKLKDDDMAALVKSENLERYRPETGSKPRFYYKNLYRFTTCFIAGGVAFQDTDECAEGAIINLKDASGKVLDTVKTNNYGDFKFDGIEKNSGLYTIDIECPEYSKLTVTEEVSESRNIGVVFLERQ